MTLDDLVSPQTRAIVAAAGLHKIAGAMNDIPEMTLPIAISKIAERAYLRRKEARSVADGIAAFGALTGEKIAENPALMALLRRSAMPALGGAGVAAAANLMSSDPRQHELGAMLPSLMAGGVLGGVGGAASALNTATRGPIGSELAANLMRQPGQ